MARGTQQRKVGRTKMARVPRKKMVTMKIPKVTEKNQVYTDGDLFDAANAFVTAYTALNPAVGTESKESKESNHVTHPSEADENDDGSMQQCRAPRSLTPVDYPFLCVRDVIECSSFCDIHSSCKMGFAEFTDLNKDFGYSNTV